MVRPNESVGKRGRGLGEETWDKERWERLGGTGNKGMAGAEGLAGCPQALSGGSFSLPESWVVTHVPPGARRRVTGFYPRCKSK